MNNSHCRGHFYLLGCIRRIDAYVQWPMLYECCLLYRNRRDQCRGKQTYIKCLDFHEANNCQSTLPILYPHCERGQASKDHKQCPKYNLQAKTKEIMSTKNISYQEAIKFVTTKAYAEITDINRTSQLSSLPQKPKNLSMMVQTTSRSIRPTVY